MWYLLKAELQYNKSILIALAISLFAYTAFSLLNYQLLEGPRWEIDYWGGILGIIFYLTLFIIWSRRIKEFRARIFSITPTTINKIASARLFLVLILMIIPLSYISIIHLVILNEWHPESLSLLGQLGTTFLVLTSFLFIRDFWLINLNRRYLTKLLTTIIITLITIVLFLSNYSVIRPAFYELNSRYLGITSFYFMSIILAVFTVKTYTKRKSFLA